MTILYPNLASPRYFATRALSNITPFTMRDAYTFEELLEGVHKYIRETLIPFVNANNLEIGEVLTEFKADIEEQLTLQNTNIANMLATQNESVDDQLDNQNLLVNSQIANLTQFVNDTVNDIINSTIVVTDPIVSGLIGDSESETFEATSEAILKFL